MTPTVIGKPAHLAFELTWPTTTPANIAGIGWGALRLWVGGRLVWAGENAEPLEGESVGARIERGPVPWREAIEIMRGVLRGLRHAHDRDVVHRDIKPDNIFLACKDGELAVKLLDFGIAKLLAGPGGDVVLTSAGVTMGTPAYLSPEQAIGGAITPATDLYSATVVLFEMLSGRAPFEHKSPVAVMRAHLGARAPSFSDIAPELEVPEALERVVQRGLQ